MTFRPRRPRSLSGLVLAASLSLTACLGGPGTPTTPTGSTGNAVRQSGDIALSQPLARPSAAAGTPASPSATHAPGAPMPVPPPSTSDSSSGKTSEIPSVTTSPTPMATPVPVNPFVETAVDTQSTFAIDVDTASYTLARMNLNAGRLPEPSEVRVEEFVNYFDYRYPAPTDKPFAIHLEGAPSPLSEGKTLMRVGIKGKDVSEADRKPANLVFLVDISGSMDMPNKLPLVQKSLRTLVGKLTESDTVAIVTYAGNAAVPLEPTDGGKKDRILAAIDNMKAGGSTNGEGGIKKAYELAEQFKKANGINRVILCTDGDFNVGASGDTLVKMIEDYRSRGVTLTTLGFGYGNYKDGQLESLANKGNGNYAYVDTEREAQRIFGARLVSTLQVIAKDVKIQIDFNKDVVKQYRLIGYENRDIADRDFTNDRVDAGEIGPGHNVTAYYELEMAPGATAGDIGNVKVRYKEPEGTVSTETNQPFALSQLKASFTEASTGFRFGAAVTSFAEFLRKSPYAPAVKLSDVQNVANTAKASDDIEAGEFVTLVQKAITLSAK
jgi:Ca-activated chloride channel family protein